MVTQELVAYVKSELNRGKTREEIRSTLLSGGGWSETDISEVFRNIMPIDHINPIVTQTPPPTIAIPNISILSPSSSSKANPVTSNVRKFSFKSILFFLILVLFITGLYFYRSQFIELSNKVVGILMNKDKVAEVPSDTDKIFTEEEIPSALITTEVLVKDVVDCGITNAPDRKKSDIYLKDPVLKCLGENILSCTNATGVINDPLFPSLFKVVPELNNICKFELSYQADNTLVDVFGSKLALRSISCPISIMKKLDEKDPKNPIFVMLNKDNPNQYGADIYFYSTLGVFIENNFDQNKIEGLGCTGGFIDSMIQSYKMIKN